MSDQWQYQLRLYFADELAEVARRDPGDPALRPLSGILEKHNATMKCQFDAFAGYVAEAEAQGVEGYPLYEWTKATFEDPLKKAKHTKSFALHVNEREVHEGGSGRSRGGFAANGGRQVDHAVVAARY